MYQSSTYQLWKRFGFVAVVLFLGIGLGTAQAGGSKLTPDEAKQIAVDAYIYGYSLITTDVTRVQMSNVAKVDRKSVV